MLAGSAFGQVGTDNLRLSYANSVENLERALARMGELRGVSRTARYGRAPRAVASSLRRQLSSALWAVS